MDISHGCTGFIIPHQEKKNIFCVYMKWLFLISHTRSTVNQYNPSIRALMIIIVHRIDMGAILKNPSMIFSIQFLKRNFIVFVYFSERKTVTCHVILGCGLIDYNMSFSNIGPGVIPILPY